MAEVSVINTHEAKTHLSRLIDRAVAGEEIVIGKAGKPLVVMSAYRKPTAPRRPGRWKGLVHLADDFDATSDDLVALFDGP